MPGLGDPVFEATVSPLLIRLLGGASGRAPGPAHAGAGGEARPRAQGPDPLPAEGAPFAPIRLRRDGVRPLVGRGALLWEDRSRIPLSDRDGRGVGRVLRLYLSEGEGLIAQIAYQPEEGLPARPIWRAERISGPDAFRNFLSRSGGASCFLAAGLPLHSADVLAGRLDPLGGPVPTVPPVMTDPAQPEGHTS